MAYAFCGMKGSGLGHSAVDLILKGLMMVDIWQSPGEFHDYRMLLNSQRIHIRGWSSLLKDA